MTANELRIGNFVNFLDKTAKVEAITKSHVSLSGIERNRYNPVSFDTSYLEPIPLTEEWLLKFGFEKHGDIEWYYLDRFVIDINKGIVFYNGDRVVKNFNNKCVHQLQNLYHALTGEELTIKNELK